MATKISIKKCLLVIVLLSLISCTNDATSYTKPSVDATSSNSSNVIIDMSSSNNSSFSASSNSANEDSLSEVNSIISRDGELPWL